MNRPLLFGNCRECQAYNRLDAEGHCEVCAAQEKQWLDTAHAIIQKYPEISREEIADVLGVESSKIDQWIKEKKVHCVAMESACPRCGTPLVNRFDCRHCGFSLTQELRKKLEQSKRRRPHLFHWASSRRRMYGSTTRKKSVDRHRIRLSRG